MTREIAALLSVAAMICRALLSNATTPMRVLLGAFATKRSAASFATSIRDGSTSTALIDNDTSIAKTTTALLPASTPLVAGRAKPNTPSTSATTTRAIGVLLFHRRGFSTKPSNMPSVLNETADVDLFLLDKYKRTRSNPGTTRSRSRHGSSR